MKILLFTGEKCSACTIVKDQIKKSKLKYKEINRDDNKKPENSRLFQEYFVRSIPCMVFETECGIKMEVVIGSINARDIIKKYNTNCATADRDRLNWGRNEYK